VHRDRDTLEAGLGTVRDAPRNRGRLDLIVCRPAIDARQILPAGMLDPEVGLSGDGWRVRGSTTTADGSAHPEKQVTVMNSRAAALIAGPKERWVLAGDQLYVDFDLSTAHAPPGTRLAIGAAVIEITGQPHLGCAKFMARFGRDAVRLVNSAEGKALNLRGVNARVVQAGAVTTGDGVYRLRQPVASERNPVVAPSHS
jgi:MOSC domain-containing protein YiiM